MPPFFVHTGPPTIVTPPERRVTTVADGVRHNANTTFVCSAAGTPIPHISWMHKMQNVSQNETFQFMVTEEYRYRNSSLTTSSTLTINNLTATDSGIVQCVAHNRFGNASADTTLSILSKYFLVTSIAWG